MFGPVEHPWFDPLWRRIALVVFCALWGGVELYFGNPGWAVAMAAITAYAGWAYLLTYKGSDSATTPPATSPDDQP